MRGYQIDDKSIIYQKVLDNYLEYITLSNKRRPIFYKRGVPIPKKYKKEDYGFNKEGILINKESSEKVIKNVRSAGTPKLKKISGQDIWVGLPFHLRTKIAREVKLYFLNELNDLQKIDPKLFPIGVDMTFVKSIDKNNWDIDNLALIYRKVLLDCLKLIVGADDSSEFIQEIPTRFIPTEDGRRQLIITIYTINDTNE
jgi:hypothetical protein